MPRVMVGIDEEAHASFKRMSDVTGMTISSLMNEALNDWYATVGEARMERIQEVVAEGRALLRTSSALKRSAQVLQISDAVIADSKRVLQS
jgi:hypothetical protein